MTNRARVFISCGQSRDTEEVVIADKVASRLSELDFEPYVAVVEQTLTGLVENIFNRLRASEYFIFIDFKRELIDRGTNTHRGSLFSHQELAIASFLSIDNVLIFQERGVKQDDGMIRFLQGNATPFTDRNLLPNAIADRVSQSRWDPNWRNELLLSRASGEFSEVLQENGVMARFFHIDVCNRHRQKNATNCYVYLDKIVSDGVENHVRTVENKWTGTMLPNVGMAASSLRQFDAFMIRHDAPTTARFLSLTDSPDFIVTLPQQGQYQLFYRVMSDNFPPAQASFNLNLSNVVVNTTLV